MIGQWEWLILLLGFLALLLWELRNVRRDIRKARQDPPPTPVPPP